MVIADTAALFSSVGALLTAIGGFILVLMRLRGQDEKLDKVDTQLNGTDVSAPHDGPTLGQRVERIERNTEEGFAMVRGQLDALTVAMRQFGRYSDEKVARIDARLDELEQDPE